MIPHDKSQARRLAVQNPESLVQDWGFLNGLVRNAVANATQSPPGPRWGAVTQALAIGSTSAKELCRRYDFNPDAEVGTQIEECPDCAEAAGSGR